MNITHGAILYFPGRPGIYFQYHLTITPGYYWPINTTRAL
jgi:hypothetical protein